jgi:hypothetical protein
VHVYARMLVFVYVCVCACTYLYIFVRICGCKPREKLQPTSADASMLYGLFDGHCGESVRTFNQSVSCCRSAAIWTLFWAKVVERGIAVADTVLGPTAVDTV